MGDLDELKRVTRTIPDSDVVSMKQAGLKSILIYAVQCKQLEVVRWLLDELHADVNEIVGQECALQRAIFKNDDEHIVKLLLSHGANTDYRIPRTPWNLRLYSIVRGQFKLLDLMLEAGSAMTYGK